MNISFVLPVLNETESLRRTVEMINALAEPHLHEILIIVADRTRTASLHVARELRQAQPEMIRVHRQELPGLGGAIREAFFLAEGTHVMLMASDLETDPVAIPRFIERMQEGCWDVVAASRWLAGAGFEGYGRMRVVLNGAFQLWCRLLYRVRLTDFTFAYRMYRREILNGIHWDEVGYPFLLECLLKPIRLGAAVTEIPCQWRPRTEGTSANSFGQMASYTRTAIRCRLTRRCRMVNADPGSGTVTSAAVVNDACPLPK